MNNIAIAIIEIERPTIISCLLLYLDANVPTNPPNIDHGKDHIIFAKVTWKGDSVSLYIMINIKTICIQNPIDDAKLPIESFIKFELKSKLLLFNAVKLLNRAD